VGAVTLSTWWRAGALGVVAGLCVTAAAGAGHGRPPVSLRWVSAAELMAFLEVGSRVPLHVVDLRHPAAFRESHVPGARSIPLAELGTRAREIPRGRIVLYCDCPAPEIETAHDLLWNLGWDDVRALAEGFSGWLARGYPISR
jgi:rhodanese-related sulfurtransferase